MDHEPFDKLISRQTNGSSFARIVIVSGKESYHTVVDFNYAMVRNGNFVGIEPQVFKDLLRASKRPFAVDHPFLAVELLDKALKCARFLWVLEVWLENEHVFGKRFFEKVEELASEDFGEGAHRDKKIAP